jgi:hypothetical protein
MTKCDMEHDLKQEVQELKISIDKLSNDISQQFNSLTENLCINFEQISKQITNLSSQPSLSHKILETNLENNHQDSLEKPKKEIPREYYIDYSYIDTDKYPLFLENLEKHNKDMAECRDKKQITPFCESVRKTLECSLSLLFSEEFNFVGENNKTFLEAYDRVKTFYDRKINQNYEFPNIYIENSKILIDAVNYKKIGNYYISWNKLEEIYKMNLPASVRILFEIIKPGFYEASSFPHLRRNYLTIIDINQLRKIEAHGSNNSFEEQINNLHERTKKLFYSPDNFSTIKNLLSWFVKEVYDRLNKISN